MVISEMLNLAKQHKHDQQAQNRLFWAVISHLFDLWA